MRRCVAGSAVALVAVLRQVAEVKKRRVSLGCWMPVTPVTPVTSVASYKPELLICSQ